ncbi:hypothetical protein F3Y22_tig00111708pilonHSYRG00377 [Hibiscus syriacus]|uniref:Integrase catalytic domain-containing protein n=1 Tax=Hibiscus syriacus TaxID=106335 RepID=A0A6A2XHJ4_HIBSY|nr:hypothetical protein F3Y22_tig00111708pilonHSYRG00377 [Hibiscus syriacus]
MAKLWLHLAFSLALCLIINNVAVDVDPYRAPPLDNYVSPLPAPYVYKSPLSPPLSYEYESPPPPLYVYSSPPPPPYEYKSPPPPPYVYNSPPPPPPPYVYKSPPPPPYKYKSSPPPPYVYKSPPPPPYVYKSPPPPPYEYKSPPPPPYVYKSLPLPPYVYKSPPLPPYVHKSPPLPPYVYKSPPPPPYVYKSPPPTPYEYKSPPPPPYVYESPPPPPYMYKSPPLPPYVYKSPPPPPYKYKSPPPPPYVYKSPSPPPYEYKSLPHFDRFIRYATFGGFNLDILVEISSSSSGPVRRVMSNANFSVELFDGSSHFGMWQGEVTIRSCLSREQKYGYKNETSASKMWKALEEKFMKKSSQNRLHMKKRLFRFDYQPGTNEFEHLETTLLHGKDNVTLKDKDCPKLKKKGKAAPDTCVAEHDAHDSDVSLVASSTTFHSDKWILDSGCTYHMSPNQEWFSDLVELNAGVVYMGNDNAYKNIGICSIRLKNQDGSTRVLTDVRYVPSLKKNIISLGVLESKGSVVTMRDGVLKVTYGALVMMKGIRKNNLYYYQGSTIIGAVAAASGGAKACKLNFCEHCVLGKQKRVKFDTTIHNTKDDFSRIVWVYPMKSKDEVLQIFLKWKNMIENQTGRKIKRFRTENGGEYKSDPFFNVFHEYGIVRHFTVRHTPQQNGVAEHMNRTLLEKVRCMLSNAGLGKAFWAEAVTYAGHLINFLPSSAIEGKTPLEVWFGKPATDYDSLHIFGSTAYYHVKESKLDPRAKNALFMGITHGVKGFRLWCLDTKRIICNRDVTFDESALVKKVTSEAVQISSTPQQVEHTPKQTPEPLAITRPRRARFVDMVAYALPVVDDDIPITYQEAIQSLESDKWKSSMDEEMQSLQKNNTWKLAQLPKAKCYAQKEGIDYNEVFSPVVKHSSIRILLALVAQLNLELAQLDGKTAFLHGDLEEEIYMTHPEGYKDGGCEKWVYKLNKLLYGLKQSPRQWYKRFDSFMRRQKYTRSKYDHCVYLQNLKDGSFIFLLLYVDDMLIASKSQKEIDKLKAQLNQEFEMKDLGEAKKILGMEISRDRQRWKLFLTQKQYLRKVLQCFGMNENTKHVSIPLASHLKLSFQLSPKTNEERVYMAKVPYANAVGSLMYAMVCTRPDISQAVGVVSMYMHDPGEGHWQAVKWIIRYLQQTVDVGLVFKQYEELGQCVVGYTDSDYAGDLDKRRSTTGYLFTLAKAPVCWKSTLQSTVALSTTEAEYMAVSEAVKEAIWLNGLMEDLGVVQSHISLYCDSQSAIQLAKNQVYHSRTKHIDVRNHFVREIFEE